MLFGRLITHLNKAKDTLESQQETFRKQNEFQQQVNEKSQKQQQELKEKAIEIQKNQKKKELDEKNNIEKELFKTQLQIMYTKFILNLDIQSKFMKTKSKHGIFWKPNKWDDKLESVLKEQNKNIEIEKKKLEEQFLSKLQKNDQQESNEVESSKFNRQKREEEEQ